MSVLNNLLLVSEQNKAPPNQFDLTGIIITFSPVSKDPSGRKITCRRAAVHVARLTISAVQHVR